jgi:ATP/maltotriose-dependent transcriptional regulator MalT
VFASLDPDADDHRRVVEMMLLVMAETDTVGREGAADLLARADRAVERLGEDAPRGLVACVAVERALVESTADDAARLAEAALRDARILIEQGPEAPHACAAAAILALAGRHDSADGHLERLMDAAAARGSGRAWAFAAAIRAWSRSRSGMLAAAAEDARACRALSSGPVWELFEPMALSAQIEVALWRGEAAAARGLLAETTAGAPRPGTIFHQPLRESIGNLLLAEGDPGAALASFEACADWERRWGAATGMWVDWRPGAVAALLRLGREEEAIRLADEQLRLARAFGAPRQLAEALRSRAEADDLAGEERLEVLREALAACQAGPRLTRARVLVDLGAAIRRERQPRAARQPLAEGLRLAGECTATGLADRATAELEATGARPRARQADDAGGLSPRERQVAERAAAGLSNPEIGQALFITRKTVETHLRSIFRKLGISSRDQIAAALAASPSRPGEGSGWLTDGG